MPLICPRCQRANPNDAVYCWYDGFVVQQGAVPAAAAGQLSREFVFPSSGRRCKTLDEIVQSCQADWEEARDLLKRGEFVRHFGQAGRPDLARAAQEGREHADPDVGLLQFLNQLPAGANPAAPRLDVTPRRIALGTLKAGEQRQLRITVLNQGRGLLQGKVAVTDGSPWLKLTDTAETGRTPIKASRDQDVSVRVDSRGMIAGQAYSGKLTVVTNGGISEVPLRVDITALPFPLTPFQGATSQRDLAVRMRTNPKQAVPLLETGEVRKWFESNGWSYPVAGEAARGVGAVQQFFECLGLSKPPPVSLSDSERVFQLTAPEIVKAQVELRTATKKWVYAQIYSDVPWVRVVTPSVSGPKKAVISFEIDTGRMDSRPLQETALRVITNGGQRLSLRLRVNVQFPRGYVAPEPAPLPVPAAVPRPVAASVPAMAATIPHIPAPLFQPSPPVRPAPEPAPVWLPAPAKTVPAPEPIPEWPTLPVEKPRRKATGGSAFKIVMGAFLLALIFRLLIAGPAEIFARAVMSNVKEPPPGSAECWRHSPLESAPELGGVRDDRFLRWFVLATWWLGGVAGAAATARRGGNLLDLVFGTVAGAAGGLAAAATAGCLLVVVDTVPRAIFASMLSSGSTMSPWAATPLWLFLATVWWCILGLGLGVALAMAGQAGRSVLALIGAPLAGVCRACGMGGFADLFAAD
jgi:hypothetical protein